MNNRIKNGILYLGVFVVSSIGFSYFQNQGGKPTSVYANLAESADLSVFNISADAFFRKFVSGDGMVKYSEILKDKKPLDRLVEDLSKPYQLKTSNEKLSLYINAYNIITINQIIQNWPIKKVTDKSGFFKRYLTVVNGEKLTLDEIENKKLRILKDARIHAAVVCGAVSCPPLRAEAYAPDKMDQQLTENTKQWINDTSKNTERDGKLYLSKIFDWYGQDFKVKPYNNVQGFVKHFVRKDTKLGKIFDVNANPSIKYLRYDWSLNQAK